jgi:hypothetical protein
MGGGYPKGRIIEVGGRTRGCELQLGRAGILGKLMQKCAGTHQS